MNSIAQDRLDYERDGFIIARNLFSPLEMERALADVERLVQLHDLIDTRNLRCRWQNDVETGACTFETFDPVIDISDVCRSLAFANPLLELLNTVYGEPASLFKDKLIFKPPGMKGYKLHQDWIAWPDFPKSFLTVLIPFDAADEENGCTIVYPGYHRHGTLSPEDGSYHELPADCVDEARAMPLVLEPGDIAIFGGFTPHRSAPNRSSRWRRQLYLSYNKLSDGGEQRSNHYQKFHAWLRKRYAEHGKNEVYFK